jgi:hypothetical protein
MQFKFVTHVFWCLVFNPPQTHLVEKFYKDKWLNKASLP